MLSVLLTSQEFLPAGQNKLIVAAQVAMGTAGRWARPQWLSQVNTTGRLQTQ
jgi:hypothetical protein